MTGMAQVPGQSALPSDPAPDAESFAAERGDVLGNAEVRRLLDLHQAAAAERRTTMKLPFELMQKDVTLPLGMTEDIRARAEKLDHFYDRIMRCRVTVEGSGPHHRQGNYRVTIDLKVPGTELVVQKRADANLERALKGAFDAAGRRLEDHVRRRRGS